MARDLEWGWAVWEPEGILVYYDNEDTLWVGSDGCLYDDGYVESIIGPRDLDDDTYDEVTDSAWVARANSAGFTEEECAYVFFPPPDYDPMNDGVVITEDGLLWHSDSVRYSELRQATRSEVLRGAIADEYADDLGCDLYLMAKPNMVKIGISDDPDRRADQLTAACGEDVGLVAVIPFSSRADARKAESVAHQMFKSVRLKGEWFRDTAEIRAFFIGLRYRDLLDQAA